MSEDTKTKTNGSTALTQLGNTADLFQQYANAANPRTFVGQLLKFSKGEFLAGEDADVVPIGTRLVALMHELTVGWTKWKDNKPIEYRMGRVADAFVCPALSDLDDRDESTWEKDDEGNPRDPWQFQNILPLKVPDSDEYYTFVTSSRGGIGAIGKLSRAYSNLLKRYPDHSLVVVLATDSYQHKIKSYGRIKVPTFAVVDRCPQVDIDGSTPSAPPVPPDALEDEVPF